MSQFRWISFQIAVAMLVFVGIGQIVDITAFGLAPALVAVFVSFCATGLVGQLLNHRAVRRSVVRNEPDSSGSGFVGIDRRIGNGSEQIARTRVGENARKLT